MSTFTQQFCTFHVHQLFLGIEVQHVQEVIRFQKITKVPLASKVIGGLINLRGQIVTALDLRERLGLPKRDPTHVPLNVVVRDGDQSVSLLVDRIGDVVEVDRELFEAPPATVRSTARDYITGAYKLPHRLLLALDTTRVLNECQGRDVLRSLAS